MASYRKVKRMTIWMRWNHWLNVFCMVAAVATGLYIGHPYYQTLIADPAVDKYVMAWNRWGHLIVAIVFDVSSIVIAYLYYFSRFDKAYKKIIPNGKNIKEFFDVFINLITFNRVKNFNSEHADSYNAVFFLIFHLLLIWMLLTGLQMYVHGLAHGQSSIGTWWPALLHFATDWTVVICGGTYMDVRIVHHMTMYVLIGWVMFHVYYEIWRTMFWQEADISIVVGGNKFVKETKETN